jgi:hypothetical protein
MTHPAMCDFSKYRRLTFSTVYTGIDRNLQLSSSCRGSRYGPPGQALRTIHHSTNHTCTEPLSSCLNLSGGGGITAIVYTHHMWGWNFDNVKEVLQMPISAFAICWSYPFCDLLIGSCGPIFFLSEIKLPWIHKYNFFLFKKILLNDLQ